MPVFICPSCNAGMQEVNRNGVHLDVCVQCRGVWLDRGELEKLLEVVRRAADEMARPVPPESRWERPYGKRDDDWDDDDRFRRDRRRKNPLSRVFEIFD